jgi:hypothetical protein
MQNQQILEALLVVQRSHSAAAIRDDPQGMTVFDLFSS